MSVTYRKPPPVTVGSDTVTLSGDITHYLVLRVPLLTGQDTAQVPLQQHVGGLLLAELFMRHLPPAERRAAQKIIDRAKERLRKPSHAGGR